MSSSPFSRLPGSFNSSNGENDYKSQLIQRLKASETQSSNPPRPKPFDITEPVRQPNGIWTFWLTADERILDFVAHLSCVMPPPSPPFGSRPLRGRMQFAINPRYEHEEAWLWIYRTLEDETRFVELSDLWEDVLGDETDNQKDDEPSNPWDENSF